MRRLAIIFLLSLSFCSFAQKLEVSQVFNPKTLGDNSYVSDKNSILSEQAYIQLNDICIALEQQVGAEVAIVIVPGIEGDDEYSFAYDLFNTWRIGKEGKNNGLLWLYVVDIRAMKFETGYGLEGLLPDAYLNSLLDEKIFPLMREGRVDEAFIVGMTDIVSRLTTDAAKEELLLNKGSVRNTVGDILAFYFILSFLVLVMLALVFHNKTKNLRGKNNVRYQKATPIVDSFKILAYVFPLPNYLFYLYLRRLVNNLRRKPLVCSHCGGSMRLLSEAEEDPYLTAAQLKEESLKSIDYDVWRCNVCDNFEVLTYDGENLSYSLCPICGAKTYRFSDAKILKQATHFSAGQKVHIYECANCHYRNEKIVKIPRKDIVVVGGVGGGSRGGGFGGGSFGGGFSGGGGAGGRF